MKFQIVRELDEEKFRRLTGVKRTTFNNSPYANDGQMETQASSHESAAGLHRPAYA
jgi:hypothetical protein